jgi:hypothetical protein
MHIHSVSALPFGSVVASPPVGIGFANELSASSCGERHRVAVDLRDGRGAPLADLRAGAVLGDHDDAGLRGRQVVVDAVDRQAVVLRVDERPHAEVDRAHEALELTGHDVLGHVAGHVDRVRAEATDDAVGGAEGRRQDEELVVALHAIDLDDFDNGADVQAGAEDAPLGDDDVVGELGREDDELVEARATVDRDRRRHVVLDLVVTATGADVERTRDREAETDLRAGIKGVRVRRDDVVLPLRVEVVVVACHLGVGVVADVVVVVVLTRPAGHPRVLRDGAEAVVVAVDRERTRCLVRDDGHVVPVAVGVHVRARVADRRERERADDEEVVVVVAVEAQLGLVRVHDELVVAGAAGRGERQVRARAQPAAGRRDERREHVLRQERSTVGGVELVALRPEHLADLE